MMGFIEPEQAEQAPSPMRMEQEQAVAAEGEAAPREEEVVPAGTAEAETGGIVLVEELERQGPALTNEALRDWLNRWCSGKKKGLPPISTWNTSKVTDFSKLFMRQKGFNDDISAWDTSSVTTMRLMVYGAESFSQPLNDWRVDKVTNMSWMFSGASSFNQPLSDWRVDKVTDMSWMFSGASSFDQPLGAWRVVVTDMSRMFEGSAFDQDLSNWSLRHDYKTERMIDESFQNSRPVKKPCCAIS